MVTMHRPPVPVVRRRLVLGVDLGKMQTPATIVAVEVCDGEWVWDHVRHGWTPGLAGEVAVIRFLESIPLGTSYDHVARRMWHVAERAGAGEIWMDATGVGVAVVEMVQQRRPAGLRCRLRPVAITSGREAHDECVPRRELLSRLAVEWQEGRVKVADGLRGWTQLRKELLALDGNGRKTKGRDDLAMGLALAVWGVAGVGPVRGERGDGRLV